MQTWQLERVSLSCKGRESQGTEWQKESLPERTQRKGHTIEAGYCQSGRSGGANVMGATERIYMCGRARATPTPAGTDVLRSRVGSQGALPGDERMGALSQQRLRLVGGAGGSGAGRS
jgi:hypothetical protein